MLLVLVSMARAIHALCKSVKLTNGSYHNLTLIGGEEDKKKGGKAEREYQVSRSKYMGMYMQ